MLAQRHPMSQVEFIVLDGMNESGNRETDYELGHGARTAKGTD